MINFTDTAQVSTILSTLNSTTTPLFGIMSPQHMVEHISQVIRISNGRWNLPQLFREEKAAKMKAYLMQTDTELAVGFRAPFLEEGELLTLQHENMESAIEQLIDEITAFENYFKANPLATPMHPALGILNHEEWIIFHNKHFKHHFKQFGLDS